MAKSRHPRKAKAKKRTQYGAPVRSRPKLSKKAVWISGVLLIVVAGLALLYSRQSNEPVSASKSESNTRNPNASSSAAERNSQKPGEASFAVQRGLRITDQKVGSGEEAKEGKTALVHYTGWLKDGSKFDSSLDYGQPFNFKIGAGNVIKGWDQGIVGMKVGGKRKLVVPSSLAYGSRGYPPKIPPDSELTFEIELLSLR